MLTSSYGAGRCSFQGPHAGAQAMLTLPFAHRPRGSAGRPRDLVGDSVLKGHLLPAASAALGDGRAGNTDAGVTRTAGGAGGVLGTQQLALGLQQCPPSPHPCPLPCALTGRSTLPLPHPPSVPLAGL